MASYYYWRPGQNCSVLEGEGVAFLEDSYDLGASWPQRQPKFPKTGSVWPLQADFEQQCRHW